MTSVIETRRELFWFGRMSLADELSRQEFLLQLPFAMPLLLRRRGPAILIWLPWLLLGGQGEICWTSVTLSWATLDWQQGWAWGHSHWSWHHRFSWPSSLPPSYLVEAFQEGFLADAAFSRVLALEVWFMLWCLALGLMPECGCYRQRLPLGAVFISFFCVLASRVWICGGQGDFCLV